MTRAWRALLVLAAIVALANTQIGVRAQPRTSGPHALTGRVLGRTARPVPNVWVLVYEGERLKSRSLTGDDGSYYISRLEERTYTIVVRKDLRSAEDLFRAEVHVPVGRAFDVKLP